MGNGLWTGSCKLPYHLGVAIVEYFIGSVRQWRSTQRVLPPESKRGTICCTGHLGCGWFPVDCSHSSSTLTESELISGFAAVTGMQIAKHKLRACNVSGQQDDYCDVITQRGLWLYSFFGGPIWVFIKDEHRFKSLSQVHHVKWLQLTSWRHHPPLRGLSGGYSISSLIEYSL